MVVDLVDLCRQAVDLTQETLRSKRPASSQPGPAVALAAVPTPGLAAGDQRHDLGLAGVERVRDLLGSAALYSVSHTRSVSIVVGSLHARLGIDLERLTPARPRIAQRILTPREREVLGPTPEWLDVLRCFCMKEAAYKVLDEPAQDALRFRGLELQAGKASVTYVKRVDDGRVVAVGAAATGLDVLVAVARPWA